MTYPIRFWALLLAGLLILQFSTEAFGDSCKYEKQIDLKLDLSSSESLSVNAQSGDLEIVGVAGLDEATVSGRACASKQEWLDESVVNTSDGRHARVEVQLPKTGSGWSWSGGSYAYIDLKLEVPQDLALEIKDSSGDVFLKSLGTTMITDSSGDLEIEDALGEVSIKDSSGDIDVDQAAANVTILSDSSGDIYVEGVNGSLQIVRDSSGDIEARDINQDVIVERDSSGGIKVRGVGGDFRVLKDGSGSISSQDVAGETDIPKKG